MLSRVYLSEIRALQQRAEDYIKLANRAGMHARLRGVSYSEERVQTSPVNQIEESAWHMIGQQQDARSKAEGLLAEVSKRENMIMQVRNPRSSALLFEHYVKGLTSKEIAARENRAVGTINNSITKALRDFGATFQDQLQAWDEQRHGY